MGGVFENESVLTKHLQLGPLRSLQVCSRFSHFGNVYWNIYVALALVGSLRE